MFWICCLRNAWRHGPPNVQSINDRNEGPDAHKAAGQSEGWAASTARLLRTAEAMPWVYLPLPPYHVCSGYLSRTGRAFQIPLSEEHSRHSDVGSKALAARFYRTVAITTQLWIHASNEQPFTSAEQLTTCVLF